MKANIKLEKYILEVRYSAIMQILDRRGLILEKIWKPFEKKMSLWKAENSQLTFADSEAFTGKIASINHMRASLSYEMPGTEQEFFDDAQKFLKLLYSTIPEISNVTRFGLRYIRYHGDSSKKVDDYCAPIRKKWLVPQLPTTIPINDMILIFEYPSGRVAFGSNKPEDNFIANNFTSWQGGVTPGLHLDIDNKISDIEIKSESNLTKPLGLLRETMNNVRDEISKAII